MGNFCFCHIPSSGNLGSPPPPPPAEISGLSECVPRCKINPPSRRPVGPFGFPATARILNNAIAKLLLGWEKSPGAGRPRLDLAEGAFNPAACRAGAGPRGSGKVEGALEGLGSLPGQDGNRVAAGRPRGGYGAPQQPVSLRSGAAHSRPSPRRWPRATLLPAALRQPPGVHGGLRGSRPSRAPPDVCPWSPA